MRDLHDTPLDDLVQSNSKYCSKADVPEDGIIVTVNDVSTEEVRADGETEEKRVLHFEEEIKPLILNRTNALLLAAATGAKTVGEAIGKRIVLYCDPSIQFAGKIVGGVRIKKVPGPTKPAAPRKAPAKPRAPSAADPNDPLPEDF